MATGKSKRKKKVAVRNFVAEEAAKKGWGSGLHGKKKRDRNRKDRQEVKRKLRDEF